MADVFVSYKREERHVAQAFVDAFVAEGLTVWWDDDLKPRASWDAEIERELDASKAVVVLWSEASVAETTFVRTEAGFALDQEKLVPVRLDPCKLPLRFRDIQTADLTDWKPRDREHPEWKRAVGWVRALVGTTPAILGPREYRLVVQRSAEAPWTNGEFVQALAKGFADAKVHCAVALADRQSARDSLRRGDIDLMISAEPGSVPSEVRAVVATRGRDAFVLDMHWPNGGASAVAKQALAFAALAKLFRFDEASGESAPPDFESSERLRSIVEPFAAFMADAECSNQAVTPQLRGAYGCAALSLFAAGAHLRWGLFALRLLTAATGENQSNPTHRKHLRDAIQKVGERDPKGNRTPGLPLSCLQVEVCEALNAAEVAIQSLPEVP